MDASHWALLAVGAIAGIALGFGIGRLTAGTAAPDVSGKIQAAETKAAQANDAIDADLKDARERAPSMRGRELEDALNASFEQPASAPAPAGPLRQSPR